MKKRYTANAVLYSFVFLSLLIKIILILRYGNLLNLSSDDLNYIKSAEALIRKNVFVFHNYNEPTVFIMPLYPYFLAGVFRVFGHGLPGMQAVRIIQALLSSLSILYVYLISKTLFNTRIALISSFLVAFYLPNIVTAGYMLTETLFMLLLYMLIYYSLRFSSSPSGLKFAILGVVWAAITLCRPTVAFYPLILFLYSLVHLKTNFIKVLKQGTIMLLTFSILMAPWWLRNYREYGKFIPLAASSGNPMLQGTYIDYKQTPENTAYYELGENAYETNRIEVETAKKRIVSETKRDFWGYLKWYTVGKTYYFWFTAFYWKEFFGIGQNMVLVSHYFLLVGFAGIFLIMFKNPFKYLIPLLTILYFNAVHCVYMAFDRYAFPVIPLLTMFCAYLLFQVYSALKSGVAASASNRQ